MSKTAAAYIRANTSGRITDLLLDTLYSDDVRKNWRNADVLARFLIDTVANAYQCENSATFEDNGFDSMDDAIESYVEANLHDWNQASFLASSFGQRTAQEIAQRLAFYKEQNAACERKVDKVVEVMQRDDEQGVKLANSYYFTDEAIKHCRRVAAQIMQFAWDNADDVGRAIALSDAHAMNEEF